MKEDPPNRVLDYAPPPPPLFLTRARRYLVRQSVIHSRDDAAVASSVITICGVYEPYKKYNTCAPATWRIHRSARHVATRTLCPATRSVSSVVTGENRPGEKRAGPNCIRGNKLCGTSVKLGRRKFDSAVSCETPAIM